MLRRLTKISKLSKNKYDLRIFKFQNSKQNFCNLKKINKYYFSDNSEYLRGINRKALNLEIGETLSNFELIKTETFPDFNTKMNYFKHKILGTSWFHFETNDLNNSFAYVFRTLPDDHTGKPHILEHTGR